MITPLRAVRALAPIDTRSIGRDALLRWLMVVPLLVAAALRWVLPLVGARATALLHTDISGYLPPVTGFVLLLIAPLLCGMTIGFVLLDQRDDHSLTALLVTPLPQWAYLSYRLGAPLLISLLMTVVALLLSGVVALSLPLLLLVALAAAPLAPIYALLLAGFASNKVEGFALTKVAGLFLIAPLAALAIPAAWQPLLWLFPTYWPAEFLWTAAAGSPNWLALLAALGYQSLLIWLLLRRFAAVMHR